MRGSLKGFVVPVVVSLGMASPAGVSSAGAAPPRVDESIFGMHANRVDHPVAPNRPWTRAQRQDAFEMMAAGGVRVVRQNVPWHLIHRQETPGYNYEWNHQDVRLDEMIEDLALAGIRPQLNILGSPPWAIDPFEKLDDTSPMYLPERLAATYEKWRSFVTALVQRYGPGGTYWLNEFAAAHPGVPAQPVTDYEIWNEQNSEWFVRNGETPDAARYGIVYRYARQGVANAGVTGVRAIVGGLDPSPTGTYGNDIRKIGPQEFLEGMGEAWTIDGVAIHPYATSTDPSDMWPSVRIVRSWLDGKGRTAVPILVNEWGSPSDEALDGGLTETDRGIQYDRTASELSRSDCGISLIAPHTWWEERVNVSDRTEWMGITEFVNGTWQPVENAQDGPWPKYADRIQAQLGSTGQAERATVHACRRTPPDWDGDGVEDQHDYAPLDDDHQASPTLSAPANFEKPILLDPTVTGHAVTTTLGTWDGSSMGATKPVVPALSVVRWEECDAGPANCQPIAGTAGLSTFTPPDQLAGRWVRPVVEASNSLGTAVDHPAASLVETRPLNTSPPTLGGQFKQGQTVWANPGTWIKIPEHPSSVTYTWIACSTSDYTGCGEVKTESADNWLNLNLLLVGKWIRVRVKVTNKWGTATVQRNGPQVQL